ncbi:hypothetical protein CYLTODRAFT_423553 [Cylindrobasidium torrendii FP15055 ss-10]|uniref:Uncharacterized protein n=1 Tax=Cylindrobasidium torrendii FP15055 ss-10 TaxID=1314674 RepID=A0A0D7B7Z7_9AGAR|nr:hypothetical protein CYLTODRAFT_423553 [Cylindrobasidium torrendii FP15055 ss-10]
MRVASAFTFFVAILPVALAMATPLEALSPRCCSTCPQKSCGGGACCVEMTTPSNSYCGNGPIIVNPAGGRCEICLTVC